MPLAAVFLGGMAVPIAIAILAHGVLELYLTGLQFGAVAAAGFALVAWWILARRGFDHLEFALAAVVVPLLGLIGLFFVAVAVGSDLGGFGYLLWDVEGLFAYVGFFVVAGIAAVALQRGARRLRTRHPAVPTPATLATGALVLVAVVVLAGGVLAHASASSATVATVEPGVDEYGMSPTLNVTIAGGPAEARLTVTGPDGAAYTRRIPPATLRSDPATVPVSFFRLGTDIPAGTYRVELTSIVGLTVDTATYTLERGPTPALRGVRTAGAGEPLELDLPANATVYRPSPGPTDGQARVGAILANEGDVLGEFDISVYAGDRRVEIRGIPVDAGEVAGNVLAIDDQELRRIHRETNGRVTVEISYGEKRDRRAVTLPEP